MSLIAVVFLRTQDKAGCQDSKVALLDFPERGLIRFEGGHSET